MESKTLKYYETYKELSRASEAYMQSLRAFGKLTRQIEKIDEDISENNLDDTDVVIRRMEEVYASEEEKGKKERRDQVSAQVNEVKGNLKIQTNYKTAVECLGSSDANIVLHRKPIAFDQGIDIPRAEDAGKMDGLMKANDVLGKVFRASFLGNLAKGLRVTIGVIVWLLILTVFLDLWPVALLALVANIVVYALMKSAARGYISENQLTLLALFEPKDTEEGYIEYKISEFDKNVLAPWRDELERVKQDGLDAADRAKGSLYSRVHDECAKRTQELFVAKKEATSKLSENAMQREDRRQGVQSVADEMKDEETEALSLVRVENLNDGVLTPFILWGFTGGTCYGAKNPIALYHGCRPTFFTYDDDLYKDIDLFKEVASDAIERLMNGFLRENSFNDLNLTLVDLVGMHFPEERTHGVMKVITDRRELQSFYDSLRELRSGINGRIDDVNPKRLANRENPFKYNVVFFTGIDFSTIDNEVSQLFVSGRDFGFIPVVFISKSDIEKILTAQQTTSTFPGVLNSADDDDRIFSLEGMYLAPRKEISYFAQELDDSKPVGDGRGVLITNRFEVMGPKVNTMIAMSSDAFLDTGFSFDEPADEDDLNLLLDQMPFYVDVACLGDDSFRESMRDLGANALQMSIDSLDADSLDRTKADLGEEIFDAIVYIGLEGDTMPDGSDETVVKVQ